MSNTLEVKEPSRLDEHECHPGIAWDLAHLGADSPKDGRVIHANWVACQDNFIRRKVIRLRGDAFRSARRLAKTLHDTKIHLGIERDDGHDNHVPESVWGEKSSTCNLTTMVEIKRVDGLYSASLLIVDEIGLRFPIAISHGFGYGSMQDAFRSLRKDLQMSRMAIDR